MNLINEKPVDACLVKNFDLLQGKLGKVLRSTNPILDISFTRERFECPGGGDNDEDQASKELSTQIQLKFENVYATKARKLAYILGVEVIGTSENLFGTDTEYGERLLVPFCSLCNPVYQSGLSGTKYMTRIEKIEYVEIGEIEEIKEEVLLSEKYPTETVSPAIELFRAGYTVIETKWIKLQTMIDMVRNCGLIFDQD